MPAHTVSHAQFGRLSPQNATFFVQSFRHQLLQHYEDAINSVFPDSFPATFNNYGTRQTRHALKMDKNSPIPPR